MSPKAGYILVQEIVPRIRNGILRGIRNVGAEDIEELIQDATAHAALLLHRVEENGKEVTVGNIAYYALLHTRSGRRSTGGSRTDVMASGTQLDGRSCVLSFEEPMGFDAETGETVALGSMLVGDWEDPAMAAGRNLDWEEFLESHDARYRSMVVSAASGNPLSQVADAMKVSNSTMSSLRRKLGNDIREAMGDDVLSHVCSKSRWQSDLLAEREKAACRSELRHR